MKRQTILSSAAALTVVALLLSGCGEVKSTTSEIAPGPVGLSYSGLGGEVHGGRSPISGATMNLYQTGTTGYGLGATSLSSTTTDINGMFTFPAFTCTAGTQLYITSTGGNPGGGVNNNAVLMTGITSCTNVGSYHHIGVSELTTVASVYALAPFMNGVLVGAPTTNQTGLALAMADVLTLVNITNGTEPGLNLPTGTTVPTAELNTLADALVSCVNVGTGGTNECSNLFGDATPPGSSTAPTTTLAAMLNIAKYPSNNVSNIVALASNTAPFQPTLSSANDLTVAVTFTGSGIATPLSLALDASGNVWVPNSTGNTVTVLSNTGAPLSGTTGYTGSLNQPSAVAIDASGNAWITNEGNNTLSKLTSSGAAASGSPFSTGSLSQPISVAIDDLGYVWVGNAGNASVTKFTSAGAGTNYTPAGATHPLAIAIDPH